MGITDSEIGIRRALEESAFALYCQPILSLQGHRRFLMGEILVRMKEEEASLIPPGDFLPVLEHYGLLCELDKWVVRKAFQHLIHGCRLQRLAINLSWQTIADHAFIDFVDAELRTSGVKPERVLFEIDEQDVLTRPADVTRTSKALRDVGSGIVLEGFGAKAKTFEPFKISTPSMVKVDGSIIRNICKVDAAEEKLRAIIRIAGTIGVAVLAECVEDLDVLTRLRALSVDYGQGFGIFRPEPLESFCMSLAEKTI